jgi:hypothetical protein
MGHYYVCRRAEIEAIFVAVKLLEPPIAVRLLIPRQAPLEAVFHRILSHFHRAASV